MIEQLNSLESRVFVTLVNIVTEESLIEYKNTILGKSGELTVILKWLKDLSPEDRARVGKRANELRDTIEEAFDRQRGHIKRAIIESRLSEEWEDTTLPFSQKSGTLVILCL